MSSVTISSTQGASPYQPINYTIATTAPTTNFDFELRYNLLNQNSVAINKLDLIKFIENVISGIESGDGTFFTKAVGGSNYVGPVL
jgi:hypothetical protein